MNMLVVIFLMGLAISPTFAEEESGLEVFSGACPFSEVKTVKDFKQNKFHGVWNVIQRYENSEGMDCAVIEYKWENKSRSFIATSVDQNIEMLQWIHRRSFVYEKKEFTNQGKFYFNFGSENNSYYIVDTDYTNYAVVWSCYEALDDSNNMLNYQNLLVLAKDRTFNINSLESLNKTLAAKPFDRTKLKYIEQKDEACLLNIGGNDAGGDRDGSNSITLSIISILLCITITFCF